MMAYNPIEGDVESQLYHKIDRIVERTLFPSISTTDIFGEDERAANVGRNIPLISGAGMLT
jgi:hypothetical protein